MTTVTKRKDGWNARDLIDFNGQQKLEIHTYKSGRNLVTYASVNTYHADGSGFTHAYGMGAPGRGDFSERVIVTSARATEKSVSQQHAAAMEQLAAIQDRARAHYAQREARAA